MTKQLNISKLKPSSKGEKDKGSINTLQASLKHSVTSTDLKTTDESIDSTNSQVHANESSQSKLEVSSYNLPPERFGIGTNKNVNLFQIKYGDDYFGIVIFIIFRYISLRMI